MKRVLLLILGLSPFVAVAAPPIVIEVVPAPGTVSDLTEITISFSEAVAGIGASDLLMNGVGASAVTGAGSEFTFTFATVPLGPVAVTWDPNHAITDAEEPANPFDATALGEVRHYLVADLQGPTITNRSPAPGSRLRGLTQVSLHFSELVEGVDAADLLANGAPAASVIGEGAGPYLFSFAPLADGPVTLSWVTDQGIADLSSNPFAGDAWNYTVAANARIPQVVINELVASNSSGQRDSDGEYSDWIELRNRDTTAVNLAGWSLSDDQDEPGKFVLPERILQPGGALLVIASGKDRAPAGVGQIHTNFKLAASGEYLGLFPPELPREPVDELAPAYPLQRNDHSYARVSNGDSWKYFSAPSPGQGNGTSSISGLLDPPHFSSPRGFYSQPFDILLSSPDPQAVIRYTTDGSEPTIRTGSAYSTPIRISTTRIIRAAAFRNGYLPSETITHSYFYNAARGVRSLPLISISTDNSNLWGPTGIQTPGNAAQRGIAWERPVSFELIERDQSGFQKNCGIRVQGGNYIRGNYNPNGGLPFSKYSFRLYFRGDYGATTLDYPFFEGSEVQSFDRIILRAGMNDHSNPFVVDEMVRRMQIGTGNVGSRGEFVNLFINGEHKGYYNATERIDDDFMRSWYGGGNGWDVIAQFGEIREGDGVAWNRMRNTASLDQSNSNNYLRTIRELDIDNFIDYLLVNTYSGTGDWPHNNWRAARERIPRGLFRFYVWDAEWSLGNQGRSVSGNTLTEELGGGSEIAQLYQSLLRSPEFRLRWADRVHKHMFNGGALEDRAHTTSFEHMRREMRSVLPGMNTTITSDWIPNRRNVIIQHMRSAGLYQSDAAPNIVPFGGTLGPDGKIALTSTASTGRIYYTTDGSDPRVNIQTAGPGILLGSISPLATRYVAPFSIDGSATVKARTLVGTTWSALTEAQFLREPAAPNLRFTEIMYNPPGGTTYEFVELQNLSSRPARLGHFFFEGISFTFSADTVLGPWERIVLASNDDPPSFAQRYPGVPVHGHFGGSLSNGGEWLTLLDGPGNRILGVRYNDRSGWPSAADGGGYSLVLRDPEGDPNDPTVWSASPQVHGSPGNGDSAAVRPAVAFSEVLARNESAVPHGDAFPAFLELHNPGSESINLGGWGLSDDGDFPWKFTFPPGSMIAGGGHLVVWCTSLGGLPGFSSGFDLSASGSLLFLTSAEGVRIDAVSFGLQVPDLSVSVTDTGWTLTVPTPAERNGSPVPLASQGDLTINEWLANRIAGQSDWIELYNQNPARPVALRNLHFRSDANPFRYGALSFIAPGGFQRLWADEEAGPEHLGFRLQPAGGTLELIAANGLLLESLLYNPQSGESTNGRYPDGDTSFRLFTNSASPGAANYLATSRGVFFNELQAESPTHGPGWLELANRTADPLALTGHSLALGDRDGPRWTFPASLSIPAGGHLCVACDASRPASLTPGEINTARPLPLLGGRLYLFDELGREIDRVSFGAQVAGLTIGADQTGAWTLLAAPTPAQPNSPPALLGPLTGLSINEWFANPAEGGSDWVELHNASAQPVALSSLRLTDDLSVDGFTRFVFPELNFIAAGGFLTLLADGGSGPGHLPFSLHSQGETLRLLSPTGTSILDEVSWGSTAQGDSIGRLPDGSEAYAVLTFPSPGGSNAINPAADRDGDLIADSWETLHGLDPDNPADAALDLDGDLRSNLYEFNSNTDPADPASFLTIAAASHHQGEFALEFVARPGVRYVVEHSANGLDWGELGVIAAGASVRWEIVWHENHNPAGYYRLVASRAP